MKTKPTNRCPFCTSVSTKLVTFPGHLYFVTCMNCHAQGPTVTDARYAVHLWNIPFNQRAQRGETPND